MCGPLAAQMNEVPSPQLHACAHMCVHRCMCFMTVALNLHRQLYWTTGHSIVQSTLSGSNPQTIFTTTTLDCVFSLALNAKLYWTERCFNITFRSIRSLNLTTLSESVIIEDTSIDPYFGVAVFEDSVFWTGSAAVYSRSTAVGGGGGGGGWGYKPGLPQL